MKKQIIIFFLLAFQLQSWSQTTIKTSTPCSDEVLFKTPGRWLNSSSGYYMNTDDKLQAMIDKQKNVRSCH
jgi:hypothetical protein